MAEARFPTVTPRASLPAAMPVPTVSPLSQGGGVARGLARLGETLTEIGAEQAEAAQRLRRATRITEQETAFGERIASWRASLPQQTDPEALEANAGEFFRTLDDELAEIDDPVVRQAVTRQVATWAIAAKVDATQRRWTLEVDRAQAATEAAVAHLERLAAEADDPLTQAAAEAQLRVHLEEAVAGGARTAAWAQARQRQARTTIARHRAALLIEADPAAAVEILSDRDSALAQRLTPTERVAFLEKARQRATTAREGFIRAESLRLAGGIVDQVQAGAIPTLDLAIEAAERAAGDEPEVRDATVARVKEGWDDHRRSEAARLSDLTRDAFTLVEETHRAESVPAAIWRQMSPTAREALERRARQLREGQEPITDDRLYLRFFGQSARDIASLSEGDLWARYRPKLDDQHWEAVLSAWTQARAGTASVDLTATLTWQEQIRNTLGLAGHVPLGEPVSQWEPVEVGRLARFEQVVSRDLEAFEREQGRKATFDERQRLLDRRLIDQVRVRRPLRTDPEQPAVFTRPDDTAYVSLDTIPRDRLHTLLNLARSLGAIPPEMSDAEALRRLERRLEDAYGAALVDASDEAILEILTGGTAPPAITFPEAP